MEHRPSRLPGGWTTNVAGSQRARRERPRAVDSGRSAPSDIRLAIPARPENVAVVRHVLSALADALDLPPRMVQDMRLALTEACTNVVQHAYRGGEGPIEVVMQPAGERLHITVSDQGYGIGERGGLGGPGLGLPLISALAETVELDHAPGEGSRLSMTFARGRGKLPDANG